MVRTLTAYAGDPGDASSTPGSGRSPGERNGNPLQYSCLENEKRWQDYTEELYKKGLTRGTEPSGHQLVPGSALAAGAARLGLCSNRLIC